MMYGAIATAAMCGQRVHLIHDQQMPSFVGCIGLRRQSRY
jgi:hypothetical protein